MTNSLVLTLPVTIRPATKEDVPLLEWFGEWLPFRKLIQDNFARSLRGDSAYLVAVVNDFPVGQVVADLVQLEDEDAGYIFAMRVLRPFQRLGIGKQLLAEIEAVIYQNDLPFAQLNVAKTNHIAERLYKKAGYQIIGEEVEPWHYTTPMGERITVDDVEWIMQKRLEDREP